MLGFASIFFFPPLVLIALDLRTAGPALLFELLFSPTIAILAFAVWFPRLTMSPDGIRIRGVMGFSTAFVPWGNLAGLMLKPGREGLILREPMTSGAAARWRDWSGLRMTWIPVFDAEQRQLLNQQRYVPLAPFAHWLRHGDLIARIREAVPALAAGINGQLETYRKEQKHSRRVLTALFLITGLLSAGAIGAALILPALPEEHQAIVHHGFDASNAGVRWGLAIFLSALGLANLASAWRFARIRHFSPALLWGAMAIAQFLLVLIVVAGN